MALETVETVFITGGTSGVGAYTGQEYARAGFRVVSGYGSNERAAAKHLDVLKGINGAEHANIKADITTPEGRTEIFERLYEMGGVTHLVLAASGGLEKDRRTEDPLVYARLMNRDAQVAMAEGVADVWNRSSEMARRILFYTSSQAWYLGQKMTDRQGRMQLIAPWDVISDVNDPEHDYGPIALTKKEGIDALTDMQPGQDWDLEHSASDLLPDSKVARAAAMLYYKKESDKDVPFADRPSLWLSRLIDARQAQLRNLGLDTRLYISPEFARLSVARALDPGWTGINHLILPDHMNQDSSRRLSNSDPVSSGLVAVQ